MAVRDDFTPGEILTASDLNDTFASKTSVSAFGAWTNWTPSFSNWSIGNATFKCTQMQIGRLVAIRFRIVMGSATTYSGSLVMTGMPAGVWTGSERQTASCAYQDTSLGNTYNGACELQGSNLKLYNAAATARSDVASTTPFSWASGDWLFGSMVYEAAADPA